MRESSYAIIRLTTDHIATLIDLRGRMFGEVGFSAVDAMEDISAEYFARAIPDETFAAFGATAPEGEIVGVAGLSHYQMPPKPTRHDGQFGYVSSMYVLPDHRQRGIAHRLMAALVAHADDIGLTWLTLHTSPMGKALYESIGFQDMNEMALHVPSAQNLPWPPDGSD